MHSSSVKRGLLVLVCVLLPLGGALRGVAQTPPTVISAGLPQEVEDLLSARQSRMQLLTPEQRNAFTQRLAAWDALPRAEREDRRARYLAWRELDATERMRLQGVANEVAAFPPERQQALHREFAALDAAQRAGWRLGMARRRRNVRLCVTNCWRHPLPSAMRGWFESWASSRHRFIPRSDSQPHRMR